MSEFTVETGYKREIEVLKQRGSGEIFITVLDTLDGDYTTARITAEEAVQIAHALLNVAEGKEADADRVEYSGITSELDEAYGRITLLEQRLHSLEQATTNWARSEEGAAVRLLEQRMSALEEELQAEAAKRAASIATIAAEIEDKYTEFTVTVNQDVTAVETELLGAMQRLDILDRRTGDYSSAKDTAEKIGSYVVWQTTTVKEPEQKFYLKLTEADYVNWDTYFYDGTIKITDKVQTEDYKTQFTQAEIDSNPELKKFESFKIPVPAGDLAESTGAFRIPVPDGMVISE